MQLLYFNCLFHGGRIRFYQMAEREGRREEFTVCLQGLFIKQIIYSAEKTRVIFPWREFLFDFINKGNLSLRC